MRNDFSSNYLMHHGILGQKWGTQNGPPYPLDAQSHSSSEKKAGWRESLKGNKYQKSDGRLTRKGRRELLKSKPAKSKQYAEDIKRFSKMTSKEIADESKRRSEAVSRAMEESFSKSATRGEQIAKEILAENTFYDLVKIQAYQRSVYNLLKKYGNVEVSKDLDSSQIQILEKEIKEIKKIINESDWKQDKENNWIYTGNKTGIAVDKDFDALDAKLLWLRDKEEELKRIKKG